MIDLKPQRKKAKKGVLSLTGWLALVAAVMILTSAGIVARHIWVQAHKPLPEINSYDMNGALRYQAKEMAK